MPAKYVLAQKGTGYHWNLLATNGRVIASSEHYNSKASAMAGIRSVQKNGSTELIVTEEQLKASRQPAKKAASKARAAATKAPVTKASAGAATSTKATTKS